MSANVFRRPYRVPDADCTLGNHVHYARYLDLLEAARGEFFRSLGVTLLPWPERVTIFPVIEASSQPVGQASRLSLIFSSHPDDSSR